MGLLKKTDYYLHERGLLPTLKLIAVYGWDALRQLFFRAAARLCVRLRRSELERRLGGRRVFVFTPSVEWHYLYQRAQQMACRYAQLDNAAAVFLTTQRHYDNVLGFCEIRPNVFLLNVHECGILRRLNPPVAELIACVYNVTTGTECLPALSPDRLVYEYVDDLRFIVSKADDFEHYAQEHRRLLQTADVAIATASALYEEILPVAKHPLLLPNAGDYAHFSKQGTQRSEIAEKCRGSRCVLGYYGALASWFDYAAVKQSALHHPDWTWLLVGRVIGDDLERSGIAELPNVLLVPAVPYESLPDYIASCDLLTIPFLLNDTTRSTSPVKLFEYMAAGKGILTSDMPECRKYASVAIYHDPPELERQVEELLWKRNDPAFRALLEKEARENTWESRVQTVLQELDRLAEEK